MAKYRSEGVFGSSEMDLSDGPMWKVTSQQPCPACGKVECFDHQLRTKVDQVMSVNEERARLEREIVTKAKEFRKAWREYLEDRISSQHTSRELEGTAIEARIQLCDSVDALLAFEAEQEKKS